jgi:hypothetical protein
MVFLSAAARWHFAPGGGGAARTENFLHGKCMLSTVLSNTSTIA